MCVCVCVCVCGGVACACVYACTCVCIQILPFSTELSEVIMHKQVRKITIAIYSLPLGSSRSIGNE